MKWETIIILSVLLVSPISVIIYGVCYDSTPETYEVTHLETYCTASGDFNWIDYGYEYQVEDYHYESRIYGFDDDGFPLYHDVRVHDGWHTEEYNLGSCSLANTRYQLSKSITVENDFFIRANTPIGYFDLYDLLL